MARAPLFRTRTYIIHSIVLWALVTAIAAFTAIWNIINIVLLLYENITPR